MQCINQSRLKLLSRENASSAEMDVGDSFETFAEFKRELDTYCERSNVQYTVTDRGVMIHIFCKLYVLRYSACITIRITIRSIP